MTDASDVRFSSLILFLTSRPLINRSQEIRLHLLLAPCGMTITNNNISLNNGKCLVWMAAANDFCSSSAAQLWRWKKEERKKSRLFCLHELIIIIRPGVGRTERGREGRTIFAEQTVTPCMPSTSESSCWWSPPSDEPLNDGTCLSVAALINLLRVSFGGPEMVKTPICYLSKQLSSFSSRTPLALTKETCVKRKCELDGVEGVGKLSMGISWRAGDTDGAVEKELSTGRLGGRKLGS